MVNVSIYGLSSEGYTLASTLALNGVDVSIIDELQRTAFHLRAEVARIYPDVNSLVEDELLLGLEPEEAAIQNSDYIFFAPKIRKIGQESINDMKSKFKDAISHVKSNTSIIFNLPLGFGMNRENIELIEHITGFEEDEINYCYMPIGPIDYNISIIGSIKRDKRLINLLKDLTYDDLQFIDIEASEIAHASRILSYYTSLTSTFEVYKYAKYIDREEVKEMYIDDIASGLFDLRIISLSLTTSNPLSYIINGSIKSIESYVKYLVDRLKKSMKRLDLKASRVKVRLAWRLDPHEMRGDKIHMLELLENRLRDYITDVESITDIDKTYTNIIDEKTLIIIACSRYDYNNVRRKDSIILKGNSFCEVEKEE